MNIFTLFLYGFILENYYGTVRYVFVFFITALFGINQYLCYFY